jgi:hypothetical protein
MMQYACPVFSPSDADLQIVQATLQVKTDNPDFPDFFRFQIIGARLAYWRLCVLATLYIGGLHIERARLA